MKETGEDNSMGDHLAIMPTMRDGANAAAALLFANYFNNGYTTPYDIGNKWSGDSAASAQQRGTKTYGENLAAVMGTDPMKQLNFIVDAPSLLHAMSIMENGDPARSIPKFYFLPSVIKAALNANQI